jgi:hypothetical protein
MATSEYMANRKVNRARPQGLLFANNPGSVVDGIHVPDGNEFEDFIVLSDDNRSEISFKPNRIETKKRMINGRMRSFFIADKTSISTSWEMLPSRAFAFGESEGIDQDGKINGITKMMRENYTTDGGAGGVEILEWYENNPGSFWVYLAYDRYSNFEEDKYGKLGQYNEVYEVFFDSFDYSVQKRGGSNFDFWSISLSLEEV